MDRRVTAWLFLGTFLLTVSCDRDVEPSPARSPSTSSSPSPSETTAILPAGPETLYVVEGDKLVAIDVTSADRSLVLRLPSSDVVLSPDTSKWAAVEETKTGGDDEGYLAPQILQGTVGDGAAEEIVLGPGESPLWSPDGRLVSAIVEQEGYLICPPDADQKRASEREADGCQTAERVIAYDAGTEPVVALGAGLWSMVGWTSETRVVAANSEIDLVRIGALGGTAQEQTQVPFPPDQVWGVSPTDLKVIAVTPDRTMFASRAGEVPIKLEPEEALADGQWSPNGSTVVAVVISDQGSTFLAAFDASTGELTRIPESDGAQGNVVWRADSTAFAYVQVDPDNRSRLRALVCDATSLQCSPKLSWAQGTRLVGLR